MAARSTRPPHSLKEYLLQDPPATAQFILRWITIMLSTFFFVSWIRGDPNISYFDGALVSGLLTFLVKFLKRRQDAQVSFISREFVELAAVEDSAHYVFYCFFMYNQPPSAIFLVPVLLYAVLYSAKFMVGLLRFIPGSLESVLSVLIAAIAREQSTIHRSVAYCEILIFPLLIMKIFVGNVFFLAPILYYYFLKMRYASRRNPSVRTAVAEIKGTIQNAMAHPSCPRVISTSVNRILVLFSSGTAAPGPATR